MSNKIKLKKLFASYYTPSELHQILCEWAIRNPCENILEPSFGGCGFLESARDRLLSIGNQTPIQNLYGCDIDINAFEHLEEKIGPNGLSKRFLCSDFLSVAPAHFNVNAFDVVIGNPPYISHHNLTKDQKSTAKELLKNEDYKIGRTASLWAYFVIHGLNFLKGDGRIAWVLPYSLLFADYSSKIKDILANNFLRVLLVPIEKQLFLSEGAEEKTVILLAEGWGQGPAKKGIEISTISSLEELKEIAHKWMIGRLSSKSLNRRSGFYYLNEDAFRLFKSISESQKVKQLGQIADIKIGIVTGDNNFFIISKSTADSNNLPDEVLTPIIPKFFLTKGLTVTDDDLLQGKSDNVRCLLIDAKNIKDDGNALQAYLSTYSDEARQKNATFKKRSLWYLPDDGKVPDAFFPYMHHLGPRIVMNNAGTTCTNTIHRIYYKSEVTEVIKKLACISILTSFSQLSAELEGRHYGSGVLKHEPSETKRIALLLPDKIPMHEVFDEFEKIDKLFRKGNSEKAHHSADLFLSKHVKDLYNKDNIALLNQEIKKMRSKRIMKASL